jgi:hypothetical protein
MKSIKKQVGKIFILFILFCQAILLAHSEELPIRLQVALMSKIVTMEKNISVKDKVSIYVLGAPKIYNLLKNDIGFKIGNGILTVVDYGDDLPEKRYDIIYIGSFEHESRAVEYAKQHDVMSLYPMIAGMNNAGSLGLGIKSGKPKFLLNLGQSEAESLHWNAKILKVAQLK